MQRLYARSYSTNEGPKFLAKGFFLIFLLMGLYQAPLFGGDLPDLGNASSAFLTPAQETELGLSVMKELQKAKAISDDVYVNEYLQGLGYRLIATHGKIPSPYQFFVVKDRSINAFALPGGFVGVNIGLILATESESELAGVLAHEIAHVQQKHIARMYEHMSRLRLSTIAGMIAAMLIATQNTQAASGAMAATLASGQQALINFTREHEKEADFVGINSLNNAGFDPMGMPAFFHRMYQDTRFYGSQIPDYLLTHPLTESRLISAQARAKSFPYRQVPDSLQYHLMQARIIVDSFTLPQEACHHFSKKLERGNYRNRMGATYGYVLALLADGKPLEAKPYLDELITTSPNQPLFQLAFAQFEMATNQTENAISRLATSLQNHPNNYPLTLIYGEWLIKNGEAHKAIPILQQQLSFKPVRPPLWSLLSMAYSKNHQPIKSHWTQAQFLKTQGDNAGAITQLRLARKISFSPQELRQIDAEIKEIQSKLDKAG